MSEQLIPYFSNHYRCDNCQEEFYRTTAYYPDSSLEITYCADCIEEEPETKPSKKISKDFGFPPTESTENLRSLEIDKRTLRKTGRTHQFNTSVSEEWLTRLKNIAYEERLNYNEVLEQALAALEEKRQKAYEKSKRS